MGKSRGQVNTNDSFLFLLQFSNTVNTGDGHESDERGVQGCQGGYGCQGFRVVMGQGGEGGMIVQEHPYTPSGRG